MEEVSVSGSFHAGKNIKCGSLRVSGSIKAENDVEREKVRISGLANIGGLLNAEEIEIVLSGNGTSRISEIGGDRIAVHAKESQAGNFNLLRIFGKPFGRAELKANSIEGTTVYLTNTDCAVVRGKTVYIDSGCRIGRVEYEDTLEISENSIVSESIKL